MTLKLTDQELKELKQLLLRAVELSYSPYSNFKVGCCIVTKDNKSVLGANVENSSFGATICAEQAVIVKCLTSQDNHVKDSQNWKFLAVIGGSEQNIITPCGICRQIIKEHVINEFPIVMFNKNASNYKIMTIEELLPSSFSL